MNRKRFEDATWFEKASKSTVLIGGAGGIGSYLTLFLSRAGVYCIVMDDDIVEEVNIGGQLYRPDDIGNAKVNALKDIVKSFTDVNINNIKGRFDKNSNITKKVFSCFDNMEARKDMFHSWLNVYEGNPDAIFIDGRLLAEDFQIFCIKGDDSKAIKEYKKTYLFDDEEVPALPCSLKQTSHMAGMIATLMVGYFTNFLTNISGEKYEELREVPFKTEFNLMLNNFKSINYAC